MDFYNNLINLSDKETDILVKYRLKHLEDDIEHQDYIGYDVESNFKNYRYNTECEDSYSINLRCFHPGLIKKNTKIIYGIIFDNKGNVSNDGNYYYIDDHSYINDFCKYIRKVEVKNEDELFEYIHDFLIKYCGCIEQINRSEMFRLLIDDKGRNIKPNKEHALSNFKGKGNALCTEYAIMAQNILSVFGIESYLVIGKIKQGDNDTDYHAFNLVRTDNKDLLIDFSNSKSVYDINYKLLGYSPFIGEIDEIHEQFIDNFINNEKHLVFEDYDYFIIGNTIAKISYGKNIEYFVDCKIDLKEEEKKKNKSK